ncbi:MAG: CHAP domain-containing protein [Actinomycetota bacterium]|nr:CHAP domain-containing protein [Actinomycetota bacterium]
MSRRVNRLLVAAVGALLATCVAFLVPAAASATGDDYPYAGSSGTLNDPWGMTERQCVSFAAWRLHQAGVDLNNYTQGWGNATNWDATASRLGYRISGAPVVGAIAQWHSYEQSRWTIGSTSSWMTAGGAGHVAYVSGVYPDGTVQLEQYNMGGAGTFSSMRAAAPRYLVITRAAGGPTPYGAIGSYWGSVGGYGSFLGAPTSGEYDVPGGRAENFAGGVVFWSPATGAHEAHGAILAELQATGGVGGLLGFPVTNELGTPDGVGRYNFFQRGGVYWAPGTGAHAVHGAVLALWARMGFEHSTLGYPTSDEYGVSGGREGRFQRGGIYWSATSGAAWVVG